MQPLQAGSTQGTEPSQNGLSMDSAERPPAPFFAGWGNGWKMDSAQFLPSTAGIAGKKQNQKKWWIAGITGLLAAPLLIFGAYKGHSTGFFESIRDGIRNWRQSRKTGGSIGASTSTGGTEKAALRQENATLRKDKDAAEQAHKAAEQKIKTELEDSKRNLVELEKTKTASEEAYKKLEVQLTQKEQRISSLQASLGEKHPQLEKIQAELTQLVAEKESLKSQLENKTAEIGAKQTEIEALVENQKSLSEQLEANKEELVRNATEFERQNDRIAKLQSEISTLKNTAVHGVPQPVQGKVFHVQDESGKFSHPYIDGDHYQFEEHLFLQWNSDKQCFVGELDGVKSLVTIDEETGQYDHKKGTHRSNPHQLTGAEKPETHHDGEHYRDNKNNCLQWSKAEKCFVGLDGNKQKICANLANTGVFVYVPGTHVNSPHELVSLGNQWQFRELIHDHYYDAKNRKGLQWDRDNNCFVQRFAREKYCYELDQKTGNFYARKGSALSNPHPLVQNRGTWKFPTPVNGNYYKDRYDHTMMWSDKKQCFVSEFAEDLEQAHLDEKAGTFQFLAGTHPSNSHPLNGSALPGSDKNGHLYRDSQGLVMKWNNTKQRFVPAELGEEGEALPNRLGQFVYIDGTHPSKPLKLSEAAYQHNHYYQDEKGTLAQWNERSCCFRSAKSHEGMVRFKLNNRGEFEYIAGTHGDKPIKLNEIESPLSYTNGYYYTDSNDQCMQWSVSQLAFRPNWFDKKSLYVFDQRTGQFKLKR